MVWMQRSKLRKLRRLQSRAETFTPLSQRDIIDTPPPLNAVYSASEFPTPSTPSAAPSSPEPDVSQRATPLPGEEEHEAWLDDYLCIGGAYHPSIIHKLLDGKSNPPSCTRTGTVYAVLAKAASLAGSMNAKSIELGDADFNGAKHKVQVVAWALISLSAKFEKDIVKKKTYIKIAKSAGVSVAKLKAVEVKLVNYLYSSCAL